MPTLPAHAVISIPVTVASQSGNLSAPLSNTKGNITITSSNGGTQLGALCASDASDVCCFLNDGVTVVPLQWDNVSVVSGVLTGVAVVLLPTISISADMQDVQLCVIPSPNTPSWTPTDVWDANAIVAHNFQLNPTGSPGDCIDQTANGNNGSSVGSVSPAVSGLIGKAWSLDPTSVQQTINLPDISSSFTDEGTLFVLVKKNVDIPLSVPMAGGFGVNISAFSSNYYPYSDGTIYDATFLSGRVAVGPGVVDKSNWHAVAITSKPGSGGWNFYQNGVNIYSQTGDSLVSIGGSGGSCWGNGRDLGASFDGIFDQAELHNVAKTPDEALWWVINHLDPSTISLGTPVYPSTITFPIILDAAENVYQDTAATTPAVSVSDPVQAWISDALDVTFKEATHYPTLDTANGQPAIRFDRTDTELLTADYLPDFDLEELTCIVVGSIENVIGNAETSILLFKNNACYGAMVVASGNASFGFDPGNTVWAGHSDSNLLNESQLYAFVYRYDKTAGEWLTKVNNLPATTGTFTPAGIKVDASGVGTSDLQVGGYTESFGSAGENHNGLISYIYLNNAPDSTGGIYTALSALNERFQLWKDIICEQTTNCTLTAQQGQNAEFICDQTNNCTLTADLWQYAGFTCSQDTNCEADALTCKLAALHCTQTNNCTLTALRCVFAEFECTQGTHSYIGTAGVAAGEFECTQDTNCSATPTLRDSLHCTQVTHCSATAKTIKFAAFHCTQVTNCHATAGLDRLASIHCTQATHAYINTFARYADAGWTAQRRTTDFTSPPRTDVFSANVRTYQFTAPPHN